MSSEEKTRKQPKPDDNQGDNKSQGKIRKKDIGDVLDDLNEVIDDAEKARQRGRKGGE